MRSELARSGSKRHARCRVGGGGCAHGATARRHRRASVAHGSHIEVEATVTGTTERRSSGIQGNNTATPEAYKNIRCALTIPNKRIFHNRKLSRPKFN